MNIEDSINNISKRTPFILRLIGILILIEGIIGVLFYSAVLIYQAYNSELLLEWGYNNIYGQNMILVLILLDIMHIGLVLSAILLLKSKRAGLFLFILTYAIIVVLWYYLHGTYGWFGMVTGILLGLILTLYYKRLK